MPTDGDRARQSERASIASAQIRDLQRSVARLTIVVTGDASAHLVVRRDGAPVAPGALGTSVAVDPGDHLVELVDDAGRTSATQVHLAQGEQRRLVLDASAFDDRPAPPVEAPATEAPPPSKDARSGTLAWRWVAGGVAVAGLALGGAATVAAVVEKAKADGSCGTGTLGAGECTTQAGVDAGNASRTWAAVATASFGVAGAGAVGYALLWALGPSRTTSSAWRPTLAAGPHGAELGLRADW
jgi:hypothetical protein